MSKQKKIPVKRLPIDTDSGESADEDFPKATKKQLSVPEIQAKRFAFTWNNYPKCWKKCLDLLKASYMIGGEEICPTTGTPHIQGYCEFHSNKRNHTIIKRCPGIFLIHEKALKGTPEHNINYCSKLHKVYTYGTVCEFEPGKRNDLIQAMDSIREGLTELELFERHPVTMIRNGRGLDRYRILWQAQNAKTFRKKNVRVYYGKTGTGKSFTCREEFPDCCFISEGITGMWWDNYNEEKVVVLDEFRSNTPLCQLLRILDGYDCQVSIKGGSRLLKAETIIITSNVSPHEWYKNADSESRKALLRRLDEIRYYFDWQKFMNESPVMYP